MPSTARLRRKSDFGKVYAKGRSCATDLVVLYVLPRSDTTVRVGFSVSGKLGKAVVRNRTRRQLQEGVRLMLPRLRPGFDAVVTARAKAAGRTYAELESALEQCARRAGLVRGDDLEERTP